MSCTVYLVADNRAALSDLLQRDILRGATVRPFANEITALTDCSFEIFGLAVIP